MAKENQLSRYGALSRIIPGLAPSAQVFLVGDSDNAWINNDLMAEFPPDRDGNTRVYSTISGAVAACTANRGDVVLVMPGHNETISGATTLSVAGVQVIGLGESTNRPTLTYTAKTSNLNLAANGIRLSNLRFLAATDSIALGVSLDTGFSGPKVDNCEFDFDTTGNDFRVMLRVGSRRSVVDSNRFIAEADTAGTGKGVALKGGAPSYSTIKGNFFVGQFDTVGDTSDGAAAIAQDTSDTSDTNFIGLVIKDNTIMSTDTAAAKLIHFSAGYYTRALVTGNRMVTYDSATTDSSMIDVGTTALFVDNYIKRTDTTEKLIGDSFVAAA